MQKRTDCFARLHNSVLTTKTKECFCEEKHQWNFNLDREYSVFSNHCIQEIGFYVDKLRAKFEETRSEISLGQDIVTEFIHFCKVRGEFSTSFWKGVGKQMRERYLNFVCSLDILDEIPMTTMYNLFKTNLAKAGMLTHVFAFNAPHWS